MSVTGKTTRETIESIEIVSDDMTQVMVLERDGDNLRIKMRDATGSRWDLKEFAKLTPRDRQAVGVIFDGGQIQSWQRTYLDDITDQSFSMPKPPEPEDEATGDCTPLDIERAKAANLEEERANIALQMELDHSRDKHVTADVPGCPACDRKYIPGPPKVSYTDEQGQDRDEDGNVLPF